MTPAERRAALEAVAGDVRTCTRCPLHRTRSNAVPGEGHPDTEVVFVGEGPGFHEDRLGRPFVGRAGAQLGEWLASIEWRRDEVFITNVVKCRPPGNRDPEPAEVAACEPFLRRQLEALDPALIVTLGRHSMARFMPGARISQAHGTVGSVDPSTGAADASVYALYHPAAALRSTEVGRVSLADVAGIPSALEASRARRSARVTPSAASRPGSPKDPSVAGSGVATAANPDTASVAVETAAAPAASRDRAVADAGVVTVAVAADHRAVDLPLDPPPDARGPDDGTAPKLQPAPPTGAFDQLDLF